jgi:hypothetical protein
LYPDQLDDKLWRLQFDGTEWLRELIRGAMSYEPKYMRAHDKL